MLGLVETVLDPPMPVMLGLVETVLEMQLF
jgi:hypothetical protein